MLLKGFMRLIAGFAKVVGAIDGSLVPIITSINASVHPPQETVDRVDPHPPSNGITCHLSSFVFLLFLLHSASLWTLYPILTPMRCTMLLLLYPMQRYQTTPSYRLPKVLNLPHICIYTTKIDACVCVSVCVQNLTNFCPYALISTPNVP